MLKGIMGALVSNEDKKNMAVDAIEAALEGFKEELGCETNDFFVLFQPIEKEKKAEEMDTEVEPSTVTFIIWLYKINEKGQRVPVREITVSEILSLNE